jgi:hypothetical protein
VGVGLVGSALLERVPIDDQPFDQAGIVVLQRMQLSLTT